MIMESAEFGARVGAQDTYEEDQQSTEEVGSHAIKVVFGLQRAFSSAHSLDRSMGRAHLKREQRQSGEEEDGDEQSLEHKLI